MKRNHDDKKQSSDRAWKHGKYLEYGSQNNSATQNQHSSGNRNDHNRNRNMKFEFSEERELKVANIKPIDPSAFPNQLDKEEIIDELLQWSKFTDKQLQRGL